MEIKEVLRSVQWAKRLFSDYNDKVESIISQIKQECGEYNTCKEGESVSSLFNTKGLRYSIMTRDVICHLTVLRMDFFEADTEESKTFLPQLIFLLYYNHNKEKNQNWEGWEYSNEAIINAYKKKEYDIIKTRDPKDVLFGYYAVPIDSLLNRESIKDVTNKVIGWFEGKILERYSIHYDFRKAISKDK